MIAGLSQRLPGKIGRRGAPLRLDVATSVRKDLFAGLDGVAESLNQIPGARFRAEEVALGSRIRRSPPEKHRRVADVLEQVGICTAGDSSPFSLFGGQQQMVALVRRGHAPSGAVMDEPTSARSAGSQTCWLGAVCKSKG